jgi:hypothetical protein
MNVDETVAALRMLMFNARGNVLAHPEFGEDLLELLHRERERRITDASRAYMIPAPAEWGWPSARES